MCDKNAVILNYGDSLLRESDLELLQGTKWLNDNIISFYFEFLMNEFKNHPQLLFVSPEVTQCLKIIPISQINVFLEPLNACGKNYIFLPVNDNESASSAGGSHWSLLVLSLVDLKAYHYDSAHTFNEIQAHSLSSKLFDYFKLKGEIVDGCALQQDNGYDCGVYLLCTAENLAKQLSSNQPIHKFNPKSTEIQSGVNGMRSKILETIMRLK